MNVLHIPENMKYYISSIKDFHEKTNINYISSSYEEDSIKEKDENEPAESNYQRIYISPELRNENRKEAAQKRRETQQIKENLDEFNDDLTTLLAPLRYNIPTYLSSSDPESVTHSLNENTEEDEGFLNIDEKGTKKEEDGSRRNILLQIVQDCSWHPDSNHNKPTNKLI